MMWLGDFEVGTTVHFKFSTNAANGSRANPSDAWESNDIRVYKNGSTTERASQAGFTVTSNFDSLTGITHVSIDLSDNTDAGFFAAGNEYCVVLYPDTETVDGQSVAAVLAHFSIENRLPTRLRRSINSIVKGTATTGATTTSIPTSSLDPAATATDQFKGKILTFDKDTATAALRGQSTDITASTSGGTLTVTALSTAPASGDTFVIE